MMTSVDNSDTKYTNKNDTNNHNTHDLQKWAQQRAVRGISCLHHVSHHIGSSRPWVCHRHFHVIHDVSVSPSFSSTSLPTSTCTFSFSPSSCTPTSTTWTPWKITCATPPRGATTPTTSPTPSQIMNPTTRSLTSLSLPGSPLPRHSVIGPGRGWRDTLGKLLAEVHRDYADYRSPEGVFVSPSSMSDFVWWTKTNKWSSQNAARKLVITNSKQLEQNKNTNGYTKLLYHKYNILMTNVDNDNSDTTYTDKHMRNMKVWTRLHAVRCLVLLTDASHPHLLKSSLESFTFIHIPSMMSVSLWVARLLLLPLPALHRLFPFLSMHSDLYSDDLDSVINNLRDSANGSLVTYDEIFHHTNCPAFAFTTSKARPTQTKDTPNSSRATSTSGTDSTSTFWPAWTWRIRRRTSTIQKTAILLKNRTMSCSIKHGMITLESLWTRRRSRKSDSLRWNITTECTYSIKCLLLNPKKGQAKRPSKQDGSTLTKARDFEADG